MPPLLAVLERVCRKPFQEIMQETLFNPLGMTETGYSTPPEENEHQVIKGVVSKNDFLRNGELDDNLYEKLIEVGILKQVNEKEAKLTKSVDALIIECAKNSIEVPDAILDIMRQAQNVGLHAWEQGDNDSHFFDPSSHIWTSSHDLTLLFQHLRSDHTFTEYFQALMKRIKAKIIMLLQKQEWKILFLVLVMMVAEMILVLLHTWTARVES